ncbi:TIGR03086 family protein [Flexivirga endophytica]|uniref:TIGR03086 family protein n=1 Tax=Flexivirga endophytica TaxID=1849103 RepID=A0A916T2N4_9MICO|nr:maleylpyruvate isomerase family mycothiol-dependent enzyme [Flexivirga endophytica]GGB25950.1 TIGR03086 family protein [Flexivirga endophytica]GHB54505.1 TIGR03086 family protein [Flexivirga endophytica]
MSTAPELALAERAIAHLDRVLGSLTPADLDRQSPCPDWKVRDVLAHVAGTASALADFARTGLRELPEEALPLDDPINNTQQAIRETRDALAEQSEHTKSAAGDVAVEFTTHAWDLDPEIDIPEDLAADVRAFVSPLVTDDLRQQFFAPEAPLATDASAGDRLLAFLGRDPAQIRRREL